MHLILIAGGDGVKPEGKQRHPYFDVLDNLIGLKGRPNRSMSELTAGLAGRPPNPVFGHDAMDRYHAVQVIIKAAKLPKNWGTCPTCHGHAEVPVEAQAKA